jgi:putative PIN family toxin of toxin-antitoxin system
MRVFLDTKVLASAVATRGLCADVVREVLSFHELLISGQVLDELERVLRTKFGVAWELAEEVVLVLRQGATLVSPGRLPEVALRDRDDLAVVGAALAGGAEVLVTGDKELLALERVETLPILSPRQFWERLAGQSRRGTPT